MEIKVIHKGRLDYPSGLELQELHHQQVKAQGDGVIITLEHEPVVTLGKSSKDSNILEPQSLVQSGVDIVQTDRGGDVTIHMPGQLVVYPILPLQKLRIGIKDYVTILEEAVILTLAKYSISAGRDEVNPGVWVGRNKICAIGIRLKDRVTLHGLALNIDNDLTLFRKIVACGVEGRGVTNMSAETDNPLDKKTIRDLLTQNLKNLILCS